MVIDLYVSNIIEQTYIYFFLKLLFCIHLETSSNIKELLLSKCNVG